MEGEYTQALFNNGMIGEEKSKDFKLIASNEMLANGSGHGLMDEPPKRSGGGSRYSSKHLSEHRTV
jgi:hypothetical protein